ncbi:MAG: CrcB family protein [Ilumatobacter sp.]|uniref:fluoride efflux transporter FluC n=1 Tax=Ilumatobacter sp. TaxID=1967498 RepID=UPI00329A7EB0
MTVVLFAVAAGVGAALRHRAEVWVCTWQRLLVVNVAGAALLGWLVENDVRRSTLTVVGVGFCGALTTFSSFALEVRSLGLRAGTAYAALTVACVCGAAALAATF